VPAGKDIPYAFQDQIYIQKDAHVHKADIETVRDMVLRRQIEPERWERRFSTADIETDISTNEIIAALKAADSNSRMQFNDHDDITAILQNMSMAKYGRLTNGGDVLFASTPELRHPQVRVRAVCFANNKTDSTYQDEKSFAGPLVSVLEEAYRFIVRNTPSLAHFKKGSLERQNEPLYPEDAIREGLVNAFAHRDYADYKGGITIHIYPQRLEIWNSGNLPEGVTLENLTKGHLSVLRNPDISHVLYLRGMMEKAGRGSLLIQDLCKEQKIPAPKWTSEPNMGVTLTFYAPNTLNITPPTTTNNNEAHAEAHVEAHAEAHEPITNIEEKILEACRDSPKSSPELLQILGYKTRTGNFKKALSRLMAINYLKMTLPKKPKSPNQKYWITPKGLSVLSKKSKQFTKQNK